MFLVMGSSQAMKVAWIEDLLSLLRIQGQLPVEFVPSKRSEEPLLVLIRHGSPLSL